MADIARGTIWWSIGGMKIAAFFLGPQHAQICISAVVLFTAMLVLHAFSILSRDAIYEMSKLIGLLYAASILISLIYRPRK